MKLHLLIALIYAAFISLGLPDSVLGIAWPTMRAQLAMPLEAAGYIAIVLTTCSAVSSFFSGRINRRFGTGTVVLASSALTAAGLLGYSLVPSFPWLLLAALPLGFGQGAVDSSLNGFVATHYSSRHMNWLHASWGIGATLGPMVMTAALAMDSAWRLGYRTLGAVQALLAATFFLGLGLWQRAPTLRPEAAGEGATTEARTFGALGGLRRSEPWVQIAVYGLYAAGEFCVGLWAASLFIEKRGLPTGTAGFLAALYYGSITAGRIVSGLFADRIGNRRMVRLGLAAAALGAALLALPSLQAAAAAVLLLGFGFAPVYTCLMHETPRRFDERTYRTVIGFQVGAACLGASYLPAAVGFVLARTSLALLPAFLVLFIAAMAGMTAFLDRRT